MRFGLRSAFLAATVLLLLILPLDTTGVVLVLFVAVDLTTVMLILRGEPAQSRPVTAIGGDASSVPLLRRTVPMLRMRRPAATIEAQVRWRQAVQTYRRRRKIGF